MFYSLGRLRFEVYCVQENGRGQGHGHGYDESSNDTVYRVDHEYGQMPTWSNANNNNGGFSSGTQQQSPWWKFWSARQRRHCHERSR